MKDRRIDILDSFRFLAIISVMLYHYTYRWTLPGTSTSLYPYGNFYGNIFEYGNRGVQFFFIISGFVISYTLENTRNLSAFFMNRFIRLFPPMVIWSLITCFTCLALDNERLFPASHMPWNFLPSLTFINPAIWSHLIPNIRFSWLNGSYWTLWVEVQFYVLAGLLFFKRRENFFRNILALTVLMILGTYLPAHFTQSQFAGRLPHLAASIFTAWQKLNDIFNLTNYIAFFTLGVIFHHLYMRKPIKLLSIMGLSITFIFLYQLYASVTNPVRIIFLGMITMFLLMTYKRPVLFFLEYPIIRRIGVISYSVYLAHENIGVLLIHKYGGYLGKLSPLAAPIMIVLMIFLSDLSYRFVEQKLGRYLKSRLSNPVLN